MNKLIKRIAILMVGLSIGVVYGQSNRLSGVVYDEVSGLTLADVNIQDQKSGRRMVTDSVGWFSLDVPISDQVLLQFSRVGYASISREYTGTVLDIAIYLRPQALDIEEVEINTGYQWIPRERATGSFVHIGQEQLAAIPGRSIMDKLDGVMHGIQFDNRSMGATSTGSPVITVRGLNSFSTGGSAPLIVVDNFPYEGDLETINPHDIESVTLLRDAAATSIWGARAGNGVLVINLKKPEQSGRTSVSWSSTVSVTEKPDLYYNPSMSSSDFVDVELFLYDQNYYRSALTGSNAHRTVFSPVVQGLYDLERGLITQQDLDGIITDSRSHDYRDDLLEHYYRNAISQQHHISISKRTGNHSLRFATGIDRRDGLHNMRIGRQDDTRYSFSLFNQYEFSKRFTASLNVGYSLSSDHSVSGYQYPLNPQGGKTSLYPYAHLVDSEGQPLPIPRGLNINYVDTVGGGNLLDWHFYPLADRNHQFNDSRSSRISPTLTLRYNPIASLNLEAIYSGDLQYSKSDVRHGLQSYEVRNLVNQFTEIRGDQVLHHLPVGEIYDPSQSDLIAHKFRMNARMDERVFGNDRLTWVAGGELSDVQNTSASHRVYGYNPFTATSNPVDHVHRNPMFLGGLGAIPNGQNYRWGVRRLVSFFANASYSQADKYILSGSIRRDASNVFGAKANERWNPLWSVGLAWNIHKESFMKEVDWISNLRLRTTYGHSGNLGGGTTSDRVVISHSMYAPLTGLPYAMISTPPNTSLKWVDVQMTNYAMDFSFFDHKINGSIELYFKNITDLISRDLMDPTTGFVFMDRNVAGIKGEGLDVSLNVSPLSGNLKWIINTSFSYTKDWTTKFYGVQSNSLTLVGSDHVVRPIDGRVLVPVHSFGFAGLDSETGDPLGYLNGEISNNYTVLIRDSLHNLTYHGSGRPLYYGFLNQSFQYKGISLFINVMFKAGHYYKSPAIRFNSLYQSWTPQPKEEFVNRWKYPGDEELTNVPSMIYPGNANRDNFYAYSEANVKRGDVIRLQQIRLSYRWGSPLWKIRSMDIGVHANNLGILWKASTGSTDPDYLSIPPSRIISTSLSLQF